MTEKNTFQELQHKMAKFVDERSWNKFHSPKNLTMSIAIEAAELMEVFQWMDTQEARDKSLNDLKVRAQLEDEIADVIIYCLSLANTANLDLKAIIERKMERNNSRFPVGKSL